MDSPIAHQTFTYTAILENVFWIMVQYMHFGFLDLSDSMVLWVHTILIVITSLFSLHADILTVFSMLLVVGQQNLLLTFTLYLSSVVITRDHWCNTDFCTAFSLALPPIKEMSLTADEVSLVQCVFDVKLGKDTYIPLFLYKHAKAIKVGDYVIGACGSRYQRSSLVLVGALEGDSVSLARIEFFAECSVMLKESNATHTSWLAAVSRFMEHPCRVWYGFPTQVWCTTACSLEFIPIDFIKSRVVYVNASLHFGRVIGTDTVFVVTPLEN